MEASVFSLFQTLLLVIGVVGVMVATIPWIAIPVIPLGIIYFILRRYFLQTSRDVKRLESTSEYRSSQIGMAIQAGFHMLWLTTPLKFHRFYLLEFLIKLTLGNWMCSHWVSVALKANGPVAGSTPVSILGQGIWAPWGQGLFLSGSWYTS